MNNVVNVSMKNTANVASLMPMRHRDIMLSPDENTLVFIAYLAQLFNILDLSILLTISASSSGATFA
jgi:hypothetical protein